MWIRLINREVRAALWECHWRLCCARLGDLEWYGQGAARLWSNTWGWLHLRCLSMLCCVFGSYFHSALKSPGHYYSVLWRGALPELKRSTWCQLSTCQIPISGPCFLILPCLTLGTETGSGAHRGKKKSCVFLLHLYVLVIKCHFGWQSRFICNTKNFMKYFPLLSSHSCPCLCLYRFFCIQQHVWKVFHTTVHTGFCVIRSTGHVMDSLRFTDDIIPPWTSSNWLDWLRFLCKGL